MPPEKKSAKPVTPLYVTTHIHTDGPIPGPHSLLTLTSAAHTADGVPISTFAENLRELAGATLHPVALDEWRTRAEDWLVSRRASRPPARTMTRYARWVADLPGRPTYIADTTRPDYLFVYWYLQRFAKLWPFDATSSDPALVSRYPSPHVCVLSHCRAPEPALAATS